MRITTKIAGIPCQIKVIKYNYQSALITALPENCYPSECEFEYEVLDSKGYKASWLQVKITPEIENELFNEFTQFIKS